MSKSKVFRGSWIPQTDTVGNKTWFCPFCNEKVYMHPGSPTYPTCPWCLSDMPEAEDFDTPEELYEAKRRNENTTGKVYGTKEDYEAAKAKRKEKYWNDPERDHEICKRYRETHKEERREYARKYYREHREEITERQREWRRKNRDRINAARREDRKANPEKYKQYWQNSCGKPMREVEAHIKGVPVEDIPVYDFCKDRIVFKE